MQKASEHIKGKCPKCGQWHLVDTGMRTDDGWIVAKCRDCGRLVDKRDRRRKDARDAKSDGKHL